MLARGGSDNLLVPGFVDLEGGGRACDLCAVGEQPDVNLISTDRHLGRQRYGGAEQGRREERHSVRSFAVESLLGLDLDEGDTEGIIACGIGDIDAGALQQWNVVEPELQA